MPPDKLYAKTNYLQNGMSGTPSPTSYIAIYSLADNYFCTINYDLVVADKYGKHHNSYGNDTLDYKQGP